MSKEILSMRNITKSYTVGGEENKVLKGIDLQVEEGEFLAILGPSGSGKSTLMNIIGCLDVQTEGEYILSGDMVSSHDEKELARIRRKKIGFIFQSFYLLSKLNALQNVELPMIYGGISPQERSERAKAKLEKVGLSERMTYYPNQLSGGQQQRITIARSLTMEPAIILADEPTGALDQKNGAQIMTLFEDLNDEGKTIIMITHDEKIARRAKRIVRILDGEISEGDAGDA